jgi:RHS repeat-associated protein
MRIRGEENDVNRPPVAYVYSGSKVLAEYDNGAAPSSPSREYIYASGALLAKFDSSGTKYYHRDQLSNRLVTDGSGNVVEQLGTFPFGEGWYNATNEKWLFTTYERDAESLNDYAMARSYVNRLGRFSSPDPLAGSPSTPQSLNRYAYVENDPIDSVDPLGLTCWNYLLGHWDEGYWVTTGLYPLCNAQLYEISEESSPVIHRRRLDLEALTECIKQLFGVELLSFTLAQGRDSAWTPGTESNGSFTGVMAGVYQGLGQSLASGPYEFTVTSDLSMATWGTTASYNLYLAQENLAPLPPNSVVGYTNFEFPFSNHVAWNQTPSGIASTQIWELGNSLAAITGTQLQPQYNIEPGPNNNEPGKKLTDCYDSEKKE